MVERRTELKRRRHRRKKMLKLTYDIFIFGLAISVVLFIGAIIWF